MKRIIPGLILIFAIAVSGLASDKKKKEPKPTPLDEFLIQARQTKEPAGPSGPSLFSPNNPNLFLYRDVKARNLNDVVTIQIVESASASNSANTNTQKSGSGTVAASVLGLEKKTTAVDLSKILQASSDLTFAGEGATTRSGQLQAWLSARVGEVLPNGDLMIVGTKDVKINNERQSLRIRGVVRQRDITPSNVVLSTAIAHMEVEFGGKGVVSDSNKPGWLYRLLSKITPF